ncbi:MAG TPA: hypothetical protein PKE63_04230 [Lacibacter sp.]|nr:hypothetical protein [Lacibacter sp.]HMO88728.1 hypothetical protein [Lacibacter sp.]HMP86458.1 hypothetical protein [Lacibacter sp.]
MRKTTFFFLLLLFSQVAGAQLPQGPYIVTTAQYGDFNASPLDAMKEHVVKVFKDGYYITASFGNSFKPFRGSSGGRYSVRDGKYVETVQFSSWDTGLVNRVLQFDYKLTPDGFLQKGIINTGSYKNHYLLEDYKKIEPPVPLQNSQLEGVWMLKSTYWDDADPFLNPIEEIKIYAYPRFAWAQYNAVTREFVGAGGGTYRFDGTNLVEVIEYFTYEMALGSEFKVEVRFNDDGTIQQTSWGGRMVEIWKRAN